MKIVTIRDFNLIFEGLKGNRIKLFCDRTKDMSKDSLKLRHEEYKLFLQIGWSGLLTLTISLLIASFTHTIQMDVTTAILVSIIAILGGIIVTSLLFTGKFNAIRDAIDKKENNNRNVKRKPVKVI